MTPIKILAVDDHAMVRDTLCDRLRREPDISVVGSASTADEAIEKTLSCNPDIIIMDIDMPGQICFDAAQTIMSLRPNVSIIFLSAYVQDRYIEQALGVKASGYITKDEAAETVLTAIREVASGGAYFSPDVQSRLIVEDESVRLANVAESPASVLTARECDVLRYIARGLSKKEIARIMHVSVKTVERHATNLMAKLDIHDRVELTRFAVREGFVDP